MHDSVRLEVLKSPPSNYIIFRRNIGANSPHKFLRLSFTRLALATRFEMHAYRPKISPVGQADFRPGKVAIALSRIVPLALRDDRKAADDAVWNPQAVFLCELIVRPEGLRHPLLRSNFGIEFLNQHYVWLEPFQDTGARPFIVGVSLVIGGIRLLIAGG